MPSDPPFLDRSSQVAIYLREEIAKGRWSDHFPPERILADELGVSRRSLGSALAELAHEGILESRERAGWRILRQPRSQKTSHTPEEQRTIGVVISKGVRLLRGRGAYLLWEMRQMLESRGFRVNIRRISYTCGNVACKRFQKLVHEASYAGWILVSPPEAIQHWCHEQKITAIVYGMGGEWLPGISLDYHAVSRHAAISALRHGHRSLALILPAASAIEDEACQVGFKEGLHSSTFPEIHYNIELHRGGREDLCALADRLLKRKPLASVWIIRRVGEFFTIFSHLQRKGIRIPEDLSLICLDSGDYLSDLVPRPTCYDTAMPGIAHRMARLLIRVIKGQNRRMRIRIMPDFITGETLGPPASY